MIISNNKLHNVYGGYFSISYVFKKMRIIIKYIRVRFLIV